MTNGELLLSDAPLNLMTFRNYAGSVMTLIQLHNTAGMVACQQIFAKNQQKSLEIICFQELLFR